MRTAWPAEQKPPVGHGKPRVPLSTEDFALERKRKNEQLATAKCQPLEMWEFVAARLYTGPVRFTPHTSRQTMPHAPQAKRSLSPPYGRPRHQMFVKYNGVLRGMPHVQGKPRNKKFHNDMVNLCGANRYVTTMHTIHCALVKLGQLSKATTVYRGMSGGKLPEQFTKGSDQSAELPKGHVRQSPSSNAFQNK